jgi:hypothetical protein
MTTIKTTLFFLLLTSFVYGQDCSYDTTLVNNRMSFEIKTKAINSDFLLLTSTTKNQTFLIDTIEGADLAYIQYPDFNSDGNADILMDYSGNNSTFFLYLFDPATNKFIEIEGYMNYPQAVQLKTNPNYYYSYHRAGCSDMNWVSDLIRFKDFKIIHLGHIYGQGCEDEENENSQIIEIYKLIDNDENNEKLIEKLPYLKFIPKFSYKWTFIEEYWNKHYAKFE